MFFSIGGREIGREVTFKVFLSVENGRITIGQHQINATIISKGSTAGDLAWDGVISVEENFSAIIPEMFTPVLSEFTDNLGKDTYNATTQAPNDTIGLITAQFNPIQIIGWTDSVLHPYN